MGDSETNQPLLVQVGRKPDVTTVDGDLSGFPDPIDDADDYLPNERGELVDATDVRPGAPFPVPDEPSASNPTVYVTAKALTYEAHQAPGRPPGGFGDPTSPGGSANGYSADSVRGVPLLAWSPGRRQAAQRAI